MTYDVTTDGNYPQDYLTREQMLTVAENVDNATDVWLNLHLVSALHHTFTQYPDTLEAIQEELGSDETSPPSVEEFRVAVERRIQGEAATMLFDELQFFPVYEEAKRRAENYEQEDV